MGISEAAEQYDSSTSALGYHIASGFISRRLRMKSYVLRAGYLWVSRAAGLCGIATYHDFLGGGEMC